jgi:hypothetical protein
MIVLLSINKWNVFRARGQGRPLFERCNSLQHSSVELCHFESNVTISLIFCVVYCMSLLVPFHFFLWPLYCLSSEILLKVALNTIKQTNKHCMGVNHCFYLYLFLRRFIYMNEGYFGLWSYLNHVECAYKTSYTIDI